jgi:hypothetical protein
MLSQMANMEAEIQVISTANEIIVKVFFNYEEKIIYMYFRNLVLMLNFNLMKILVVLNVRERLGFIRALFNMFIFSRTSI